jgi:uncharacterized protein YjbI with pentapeptide repeats
MRDFSISDFLQILAILGIVAAVVYGIIKYIHDYLNKKAIKRDNYYKSFDTVVAQLSSDVKTSQLSAAVLMRRYFNDIDSNEWSDLRVEAINVISSLLKVLPCGVFQKTLGDGLAYAIDLTRMDLQSTNLQNLYLGRKDGIPIEMKETDMFMADLSYATLNNIHGQDAVFLHAVLYKTRIKNSDLTRANFCGADLSDAFFKDTLLYGADFSHATNIPEEIEALLSEDRKIVSTERITTLSTERERKVVFFSMPGNMSKEDEILTKDYKTFLETQLDYKVLYYIKDEYPEFGQFNKIRKDIMHSSAMIAFGFKQISIEKGISHPNTAVEKPIVGQHLPTPWNELEVGMGLMHNLPILLVKDKDINSGVFDSKLSECFVATITVDYDNREIMYYPAMKRWLAAF